MAKKREQVFMFFVCCPVDYVTSLAIFKRLYLVPCALHRAKNRPRAAKRYLESPESQWTTLEQRVRLSFMEGDAGYGLMGKYIIIGWVHYSPVQETSRLDTTSTKGENKRSIALHHEERKQTHRPGRTDTTEPHRANQPSQVRTPACLILPMPPISTGDSPRPGQQEARAWLHITTKGRFHNRQTRRSMDGHAQMDTSFYRRKENPTSAIGPRQILTESERHLPRPLW